MGIVLVLVVLIFSIVLHEIAHGYAALKFGDSTAKDQGRLTLNPLVHIDLFGSIILPALLYFMSAPILAWAKPVPVDFYALRPRRLGRFVVAMAGVAVNFLIAVVAALIFRLIGGGISGEILLAAVYINLLLMLFNLMPIPPLDGSHLWMMWLSEEQQARIRANTLLFFILLIFMIPRLPIWNLILPIYRFLTGFTPF